MFNTEDTYAYFQGNIVPFPEANLSIMTHAFNYGTGYFGGIRGYWNEEHQQLHLFRLQEHYDRLCRSGRLMMMSFAENYTFEQFQDIIMQVLQKSNIRSDVYIRPIVYKSSLEIGPRMHNIDDDFTIYLVPLGDYVALTGLRCGVSSWRRVTDNALPARGKINGAYVNSAFAKTEALQNGYDEAIVLDEDGFVVEGSAENIGIVRDGTIITPSFSSAILEGITLKTVKTLATDHKIPLIERSIARTELYSADEVFLCGTGAQISPVIEIDNRPIADGKPGKISTLLQEHYFNLVKGKTPQSPHHKQWLTPVYKNT